MEKGDPDGSGGTRGPSIPGGSGGPCVLRRQSGRGDYSAPVVRVVQVVRMIGLDDMHSENV